MKKVAQQTISGEVVKIHNSMRSAARDTGINVMSISDATAGKQKQAGGFIWDLVKQTKKTTKIVKESKVQSTIVDYLTKNKFYNNKSIKMSRSGLLDLITVKSGITYYFEVKATNGVVSPLQEATIKKLNEHKKIAFVVKSFQQFIQIWEGL